MKEKILILIVCLLLLVSFIHAEEEIISPELLNIGEALGFTQGNEIFGWGIKEIENIDQVTFRFDVEGAQLSINGALFKNIIPYNPYGVPVMAHIVVNKSNAVILEIDFTTNNQSGNYTINGKTLELPPNTQVTFSGQDIQIKIPEGADLTKYLGLFDFIPGSSPTILRGFDAILPDGSILDGDVEIHEKGYLLKLGTLEYKGYEFDGGIPGMDRLNGETLISDFDHDLSDYGGNYVQIEEGRKLNMQSVEGGRVEFEIVGGNKLFNAFKPKYKRNEDGSLFVDEEGEAVLEILSDEQDRLLVIVEEGDSLSAVDRSDSNQIPYVVHDSPNKGGTFIRNGRVGFSFIDGEVEIETENVQNSGSFFEGGFSESVAFQLSSPNLKKENSEGEILDYELRINSGNVFAILDPEQAKQQVAFNSRNFEVSDDSVYNLAAQSLDYLNSKYSNITFFLVDKNYEEDEYFYANPSPQLIQIVDKWFEEDPRRTEFYSFVEFTGEFNSAAGYKYLMVGEQAYDLYATEQIRDITDPRWILTHEHQHETDHHVEYEEGMQLNKILRDDLEAQKLLKDSKKADKLLSSYFKLEGYHLPDLFSLMFLSDEELEIPLQERNALDIQEFEEQIQEYSQNIYMALGEDNKNSVLTEDILTEVYNKNQKRHEMYNLLFDSNVEKMNFIEADPLLEELAEISTEIEINLNELEQVLIEEGCDKEIVDDVKRLNTIYEFYDGKPTTGTEAQINWYDKKNPYGGGLYGNRKKALINEVPYLEEQFATYVSSNPKTKRLEHIYGDLAVDIAYDIMHDDEMRLIRNRIAGEIKQKLVRDFDVDFWEIRKEMTEYNKEYWDSKSEDDFELALISHATYMLEENSKKYSETGGITYDDEKEFLHDLTFQLRMLDDTSIKSATKEASKSIFSYGTEGESGLPPLGDMFRLQYRLRSEYLKDNPIYEELSYRLEDLYEIKHGVPAAYSFYNYGNQNKKYSGRYSEIASTYREQPIEIRRQKVHSGTNGQKRSFNLLTQAIFDAGEMDISEFVQIMGVDYDGDGLGDTLCSTSDCIEYRCVEYKFLCCQQYPESPNC